MYPEEIKPGTRYELEPVAGKTAQIEWFTPVYMGDTLFATAELTGVRRRNPHNGVAEITLSARNQQDRQLFQAVVEAVVLCRPAENENRGPDTFTVSGLFFLLWSAQWENLAF